MVDSCHFHRLGAVRAARRAGTCIVTADHKAVACAEAIVMAVGKAKRRGDARILKGMRPVRWQ